MASPTMHEELNQYVDFCLHVIKILKENYAMDAAFEFPPGCIVVGIRQYEYWYGTANETWGASLAIIERREDGSSETVSLDEEYVNTAVKSDCRHATTVAQAIYGSSKNDWEKRTKI